MKGHEAAIAEILSVTKAGRVPHGWLFTGPEGIGKATLARRFAAYMLAGQGAKFELPENHPTLQRMNSGGHADFTVVKRTENDSGNLRDEILVDDVRRIEPMFRRTSAEGGWRVALVDEADRMNESAQNAILKILEEPPANALLLLTAAQPGRLLPTIRSRVRKVALAPLSETEVSAILAEEVPELTAEQRTDLAILSGGSPGRALALHQAEGAIACREFMNLAGSGNLKASLDFAERHGSKSAGESYAVLSRFIPEWLMEVAKAASNVNADPTAVRLGQSLGPTKSLALYDQIRELFAQSEGLNLDRKQTLLAALFALEEAQKKVA